MISITESFRRRITNAELVLPLVDDTLPQVRIRLDLLKEMLDEIDAEHERRMEQAVETTLGRGTCKVEGSIDYGEFGCWQYDLSCGCRIIWPDSEPPVFCPECGRRCVG